MAVDSCSDREEVVLAAFPPDTVVVTARHCGLEERSDSTLTAGITTVVILANALANCAGVRAFLAGLEQVDRSSDLRCVRHLTIVIVRMSISTGTSWGV